MTQLLDNPWNYNFYQAVRLLHLRNPRLHPVGREASHTAEVIRFKASNSFSFPASSIARLEGGQNGQPCAMTIAFMGLADPASFGSLPSCYTELIEEQNSHENPANRDVLRDFLDVFNHRLISLFYRAWEKHSPAITYERSGSSDFESALFSLMGLGDEGTRDRLHINDRALLFKTGILSRTPVSRIELEALLSTYFRVKTEVIEFVTSTYEVSLDASIVLGDTASHIGSDSRVIGSRVHLSQFNFRVRLGPIDWQLFESLMPGGDAHFELLDLIRLASGIEFDFSVQLILRREDVPTLRLGKSDARTPLLGLSTWLVSDLETSDVDDVVFTHSA